MKIRVCLLKRVRSKNILKKRIVNFERLVEKVIESHRIRRGQKSGYPVKDYRSNVFFFLKGFHYFLHSKILTCSNISLFVSARRLEKEVKQVLDEISYDSAAKERLIRGRQVDLAEELSK